MEACCSSSILTVHPMDVFRRRAGLGLFHPSVSLSKTSLDLNCRIGFHRAPTLRHSISDSFSVRRRSPFISRRGRRQTISAVFERFTERAIKAVVFSQREARALGKEMVFPQHLLLGLIAEDRSQDGFLGSGITIGSARDAVRSVWNEGPSVTGEATSGPTELATNMPFSISTKHVFEVAVEFSRSSGCNFIAPEHIAVGLLTADDGSTGLVLKRLGVDASKLTSAALSRLQGELVKDGRESSKVSSKIRKKSLSGKVAPMKFTDNANDKSFLAHFCVDLTALAHEGRIDPVIGREVEIERVVQILCRRTKNNPILLGEPGVGKTAIAEGLALTIFNGDIPIFLASKRIMSLDIGLLMAGAKERGELEARVTGLIAEVRKAGDVILFIDEVHTLIGSGTVGRGNKGSGLDISNLLKPALGRGELQCIASTTLDEHMTHFEKDKALARRFQPVLINEPSQEDAVKILLGLRGKYESYHGCGYTLDALNAAVYLSARYIPDRKLPDKAIDLIDEAGSRARMNAFKRKKEEQTSILSKSPYEYWQEIRDVQAMHQLMLANKLEKSTSKSTVDEHDSVGSINDTSASAALSLSENDAVIVGPEEIAVVASLWSGIPVKQLTADEVKLLVGLDDELQKRVIGQDEAVSAISKAVKRSRVGLKNPSRPIATMLFCGPTGVGKTELTKALAASYFGSESSMLRLDMSEYMERFTVSKLIGSPPGYLGYGDGGTLTEAVRRKPFTVILLDEIEKAHPDIFNILLQIFEDGHLTDSQGRKVSFKNTLIVMTSNVGSTSISKGRMSIGFLFGEDSASNPYSSMKSLVMEELKTYFRPELLNRIDEVVVFHPLEKKQMMEILDILLRELKSRLLSLGMGLQVSSSAKDLVCQQGYDKKYGARPMRRAVTNLIENPISEALLARDYKPGDSIVVDVDASGNLLVSFLSDQAIHLPSDTASTL
ncbi:hypothetical protein HPP92_021351 [Vanilla planifolia]|uniref:Clp R domain-containing protein n=1 Tax=Vanilla planifolia TaxID=51239 RepID=A0A835PYQ4_VANPL|nr:hypothetical protein HPP92_021351 [Vanilla planifolia]